MSKLLLHLHTFISELMRLHSPIVPNTAGEGELSTEPQQCGKQHWGRAGKLPDVHPECPVPSLTVDHWPVSIFRSLNPGGCAVATHWLWLLIAQSGGEGQI
jgi:hypothetical protein